MAAALAEGGCISRTRSAASFITRPDGRGMVCDRGLDKLSVVHAASFGAGTVEVQDYTWGRPSEDTWICEAHFLHLTLTRRPGPGWAAYLDNRRCAKEPIGRLTFVPAGRVVHSGGPSGKQRSLICMLSTELFDSMLPEEPDWDDVALAEALRLDSPEIEWLLLRMYDELKDSAFGRDIVIESLITALGVALIRRLGLSSPKASFRSGGLAPWRLRRIDERIRADLPAPSIGELAEACGMSVRHLSRTFKAEKGVTIANYVQEAVVQRACVLLSESGAPISDVARQLGFATATSFSTAFRRATGLRPSQVHGRLHQRMGLRLRMHD